MSKENPKILFVGKGRAGKDEAATFLDAHCGLRYGGSTSWAALPLVAQHLVLHPMFAWETRHDRRIEWKAHCDWLRRDDPCFLIKRALETGNVITGVRGLPEIEAAPSVVDYIVWIENPRAPHDPTVDFGPEKSTDQIINDGTLRRFHTRLIWWAIHRSIPGLKFSPYANELLTHHHD